MVEILVLILSLALLIWLTMRGANLIVVAPFCALILAFFSGIDIATVAEHGFTFIYMKGFTSFFASWFLVFLLGSIFGKLMEDCGAAEKVSHYIMTKVGSERAAVAVVLACAVLTYGGVSVFVVAFTSYPIALSLFREANLPRRFIPGCLAFGSATFTMTTAGSPEIQNWIPIKYLHTSPWAGWEVSIPVAIFMAIAGFIWLNKMITTAVANGENFEHRDNDPHPDERNLPALLPSLLPLFSIVVVSFLGHETLHQNALVLALLVGCILTYLLNISHFQNIEKALNDGAYSALIATGNTCAVVGFGAVAKMTPGFDIAMDFVMSLPGSGLVSASVAIIIIAGITGSASGGQSIALPELAPHYLNSGVDAGELHRVVAISSGALDSLPHNGYVVTTVRAICGESHASAYGPIFALTVILPLIGTVMAVALFGLF
ncbi:GntP family permease [Thalassotalea psychrophila]|uniref:GntP family permease n=1 Tax=Thalassotalea psychrophila TaxID=3065647 RepID=A0ABY9U620_9GAMM|nr:GntP family permease [Colwelliaceae bacterium SQ149]